jgi:hypothetical protein
MTNLCKTLLARASRLTRDELISATADLILDLDELNERDIKNWLETLVDALCAVPVVTDERIERLREALAGLVEGVVQHCNEPGGGGTSGYLSARLTDARNILSTFSATPSRARLAFIVAAVNFARAALAANPEKRDG